MIIDNHIPIMRYHILVLISIGNPPKGYNIRLENLVSPKVSTRLAALFSKVVMGPAQKIRKQTSSDIIQGVKGVIHEPLGQLRGVTQMTIL